MQEHWKFRNTPRLSSESLVSFLENQTKELEIFLSYYYRGKSATAENVKLRTEPIFKNPKEGSFILSFEVSYFDRCRDIDERAQDQMKITFKFDEANLELHLLGEDWNSFQD